MYCRPNPFGNFSSSNRERRHIRIKSLPNEWHTLTQTIRIERPRADLAAERLHAAHELAVGRSCSSVHVRQHERIVEHVDDGAIRADEIWAGKEGADGELRIN
jgi:hypothetical protein